MKTTILLASILLISTSFASGEKNLKLKIKRKPNSVDEKLITLNGKYMAKRFQALSMDESTSNISAVTLLVENRALTICKSIGYKLVGYEDIELVDFDTREPSLSIKVSDDESFKDVSVSKYYAFSRIYCEYSKPSDAEICELKTHNTEDVFFITTRRKDNCK